MGFEPEPVLLYEYDSNVENFWTLPWLIIFLCPNWWGWKLDRTGQMSQLKFSAKTSRWLMVYMWGNDQKPTILGLYGDYWLPTRVFFADVQFLFAMRTWVTLSSTTWRSLAVGSPACFWRTWQLLPFSKRTFVWAISLAWFISLSIIKVSQW